MARSTRRGGSGPVPALAANEATANRLLLRETEIQQISQRYEDSESALVGLREELLQVVERFQALIVDCHPFDVVESVRRQEFPATLEGHRETNDHGLGVASEVAAALATIPPSTHSADVDYVHDVATLGPALSDAAHKIVGLVMDMSQIRGQLSEAPGAHVAFSKFARSLLIRGNQHPHIERGHLLEIFASKSVEASCLRLLGVTVKNCLAVIDAAEKLCSERYRAGVDELDRAADRDPQLDRAFIPSSREGYLVRALTAELGRMASFRPEDLVDTSGCSRSTVETVLELLSFEFASTSTDALLDDLLSGKFMTRQRAFARLGNKYVIVNSVAATDMLRTTFERALQTDEKGWRQYSQHRGRVAESIALRELTNVLGVPPTLERFKYYFSPRDHGAELSEQNGFPKANGFNLAEGDGLFVFETVAIIVEIKAGGITRVWDPERPGALVRDLKKLVGGAVDQAARLEYLARRNNGIWLADGSWLELPHIVEVHKIVVSLEELGRSAIDIDELVRVGVLSHGTLPWVVSLHDLAVISEVGERPPVFLLYLRRRTSPKTSQMFTAHDELDLYMLFLDGQLRALEDPFEISRRSPATHRPTKRDIDAYDSQPQVVVMSQTDELVAWLDYAHGRRRTESARPILRGNPRVLKIVDFLVDGHKPGWMEAGADLLKGNPRSQQALARALAAMLASAKTNPANRSVTFGVGDLWGYSLILAIVADLNDSIESTLHRIEAFVSFKKYQTRAPRALGLVFTLDGEIVHIEYSAGPWEFVEGADSIIGQLRLHRPASTVAPPYSRRNTKRLKT